MSAARTLLTRLAGYCDRRLAEFRLAAMDDRMLKDIGLHRSEISAAVRGDEAARRQAGAFAPAAILSRNGAASGPVASLRSAVIEK